MHSPSVIEIDIFITLLPRPRLQGYRLVSDVKSVGVLKIELGVKYVAGGQCEEHSE